MKSTYFAEFEVFKGSLEDKRNAIVKAFPCDLLEPSYDVAVSHFTERPTTNRKPPGQHFIQ